MNNLVVSEKDSDENWYEITGIVLNMCKISLAIIMLNIRKL